MSVSVKNEPDGNDRNSVAETQAFLSQRKIDNLYNSEMSKNDPLGTLLKDARWKRHLTQQQLADAMDLTRANISAWENGLHRPNIKQLFRLSKLLNIDWHMLMSNAHGDAPPGFDWDTPEPDEQPEVLSSPPRSPKPKPAREVTDWPFSFPRSVLDKVPPHRMRELELIMLGFITEASIRTRLETDLDE